VRPADDLARELRRDGARPFLTWYDDADGARVELSVATTANWVAKIANWLVDEADVVPGDELTPGLSGHWLAPLCALAAWSIGARVGVDDASAVVPDEDPAVFQRTVLAQPDEILTPSATEVGEPAVVVPDGARVMSSDVLDEGYALALLLAVLRAGGSLVLVTNADAGRLAGRAATERVTHTAGVAVENVPRVL
jgi:hypothetical protein